MKNKRTQAPLPSYEAIKGLCKKYNLDYLWLFGSQARGDAREDSDADLMIEFSDQKTLFDMARIKIDLERLFNRRVDLVVRRNVKPMLKPFIESDLQTLYAKNRHAKN